MARTWTLLVLAASICAAADKKPPVVEASNLRLALSATLYADQKAVERELGREIDEPFLVVKAELIPRSGALAIHHDQFVLRSDKDGQRSGAMSAGQIAGGSALVVSSRGGGGGGMVAENPGPVWGGIPTGRPQRTGGESPIVGNVGGQNSAEADVDSSPQRSRNPLLTLLKQKALPEKETEGPVSGLLYFHLDGKHKPKDLELLYDGPAGKMSLRFR